MDKVVVLQSKLKSIHSSKAWKPFAKGIRNDTLPFTSSLNLWENFSFQCLLPIKQIRKAFFSLRISMPCLQQQRREYIFCTKMFSNFGDKALSYCLPTLDDTLQTLFCLIFSQSAKYFPQKFGLKQSFDAISEMPEFPLSIEPTILT